MFKFFLLFIFGFQAFSSFAQLNDVSGLVFSNSERLNGAWIKNLNTRYKTLSNQRGEFHLIARPGDSLVAFKTNYLNDTLVVTNQQSLLFQLHKSAIILKTVTINSTAISPEATLRENKKEYKEIYRKGDKSNMVFIPLPIMGFGLGLNIDKLYNALSKEGKDARKLQRTFIKDYQNSVVDKRFNPIAAQITGYKNKRLQDFIQDNRPSYEMVIKSSDYDIVRYIMRKMQTEKNR